jgi:transcriptional repressor NrdR
MRCPKCLTDDTKVIDSRDTEEGAVIRRRRLCTSCSHRFTTYERLEEVPLMVAKSHGGREPFDRVKLVAGLVAACKGRPVDADQIDTLATELEDHARLHGVEITSTEIGLEVLDRLRVLDEVAYLRFASVYKNFDRAADFQREATLLTKLQERSERSE